MDDREKLLEELADTRRKLEFALNDARMLREELTRFAEVMAVAARALEGR